MIKEKFKSINKFQILLTVIILLLLLFLNNIYIYGSENTQVRKIGYLKNNNQFTVPVENYEEIDNITKSIEKVENPKITIEESNTLLDYETETDPKEYIANNQESMIFGTEMKVGANKLYLTDASLYDEAKNMIVKILLQDDEAYSIYLQNGDIENIEYDDKTITNIAIADDISFENIYVPEEKLISTPEELILGLFHKDYTDPKFKKQIYSVKSGDTINSVLESNDITVFDFFINNPQYQGIPLLNEGDEILINKIDPLVTLEIFYKEEVEEVEEFDTIRRENEDMDYGDEELIQKGKNGKSLVTYQRKAVNGEVVSSELIKKEAIVEPTTRIIEEGTNEDSGYAYGGGGYGSSSTDSNYGGMIWPSDSHSVSRGLSVGHNGTDIIGPYGSPIYATADGVVETSGWSSYGGGNEVTINHGGGVYTIYSHQSQTPLVSPGQTVYQGQLIGYMGASGNAYGTHLHFEVRTGCTSGAFSGYPVAASTFM